MKDTGRRLIRHWHEEYAPGLEPQPIPTAATVDGLILPLIPYGLQYRVVLPDGSIYPRHQSGPGATVAITDGERIVLKKDYRPESDWHIWKCAGGFAANERKIAAEIVQIYNALSGCDEGVSVRAQNYPALRQFLGRILRREFNGWILGWHDIVFLDRPIGNPNIRICSIMGVIRLQPKELDDWRWPAIMSFAEVREYLAKKMFGDENTDRLLRRVMEM